VTSELSIGGQFVKLVVAKSSVYLGVVEGATTAYLVIGSTWPQELKFTLEGHRSLIHLTILLGNR
jgi:hypothetical protein